MFQQFPRKSMAILLNAVWKDLRRSLKFSRGLRERKNLCSEKKNSYSRFCQKFNIFPTALRRASDEEAHPIAELDLVFLPGAQNRPHQT
jgi:hypothetical protein